METKPINVEKAVNELAPKAVELMNIVTRVKSPTPKFFRVLRNVGLALGTVSALVATLPVSLPATIVAIAGYCAVGSGIAAAVSQMTVKDTQAGK
jgi:S-adenosylhomocysteine hydrolase